MIKPNADIYVTKYTLSSGILRYTLDRMFDDGTVIVHSLSGMNRNEMYHKPDWHLTLEEAVTRAELMRRNKIVSLAKQADKIKKIDFDKKPILDMRWDGKVINDE